MPTVANSMLTGHLEHGEEVHGAQSQQVAVVFAKVLALVKWSAYPGGGRDTHTNTLKPTETASGSQVDSFKHLFPSVGVDY